MRSVKLSSSQPLLIAYLQLTSIRYFWLAAGKATSAREVKQLTAQEAAIFSQQTPITAVIAASCVSSFSVELPPSVKANEALLLIEDQLSQPIEELTTGIISQQGRQLNLLVINSQLLTNWQEEFNLAGIHFNCWQAETAALQQLWHSDQPLILANQEEQNLEIWLASNQSLLSLPASFLTDLAAVEFNPLQKLLTGLAIDALPEIKNMSLAERLAWLAPALIQQKELWPLSWWQQLTKHPKLQQLSQLKNLAKDFLIQLNPYKKQLLPWALSLTAVLIAGLFNLLQPKQADAHFLYTAKKFEQQLDIAITHPNASQTFNQQLASLGEQLSYQQSRFNAWQSLNQVLTHYPKTQLIGLQLSPEGLSAQLIAPEESLNPLADALKQLGGKLTLNNDWLTWQLTNQEVEGF